MEYEEGQNVGADEGRIDPAFDAIIDDRSSSPQEHHGQSVVLAGVVPGAPGQKDRNQHDPDCREIKGGNKESDDQDRRVNRKVEIAAPVLSLFVNTKERRAVMGVADRQHQ
jgi:hypothetical protein